MPIAILFYSVILLSVYFHKIPVLEQSKKLLDSLMQRDRPNSNCPSIVVVIIHSTCIQLVAWSDGIINSPSQNKAQNFLIIAKGSSKFQLYQHSFVIIQWYFTCWCDTLMEYLLEIGILCFLLTWWCWCASWNVKNCCCTKMGTWKCIIIQIS